MLDRQNLIASDPRREFKDRVRVNRRIEIHPEGVYYIEWREERLRRRQAIANRHLVLEHARLKALELDARRPELRQQQEQLSELRPYTRS